MSLFKSSPDTLYELLGGDEKTFEYKGMPGGVFLILIFSQSSINLFLFFPTSFENKFVVRP